MISTRNNIQLFIQFFIYTKVIIKASRKKKTEEQKNKDAYNQTT